MNEMNLDDAQKNIFLSLFIIFIIVKGVLFESFGNN